MNKEIKFLIGEIIIITFLSVMTLLFLNKTINNKDKIINNYYTYAEKNITIEEKTKYNYNLYPMTDNYAINNLKDSTFIINNIGNKTNYELLLVIDKNSTLNTENIKFKVNDKVINLNNYNYQDDHNLYYYIEKSTLKEREYKSITYKLWLDENTNIITGNNINYHFELI